MPYIPLVVKCLFRVRKKTLDSTAGVGSDGEGREHPRDAGWPLWAGGGGAGLCERGVAGVSLSEQHQNKMLFRLNSFTLFRRFFLSLNFKS